MCEVMCDRVSWIRNKFRWEFSGLDLHRHQQLYYTKRNDEYNYKKILSVLQECIGELKNPEMYSSFNGLRELNVINIETDTEKLLNVFELMLKMYIDNGIFVIDCDEELSVYLSKNGFCGPWCHKCNTHYSLPSQVVEKNILDNNKN